MTSFNEKKAGDILINYSKLIKECFWDYDFTAQDIKSLSISENKREQLFLFQKILLNSSCMFNDLKIFDLEILKKMIQEFQVPEFNNVFVTKRKNMAEVYFLNSQLKVSELKWE